MASAAQVVLVEGEKCAQALIDAGIVATTAMHGANAPVDKTDWSPLAGKAVLIWPDRDKPGWEYATLAAQAILSAGAKSCHILYPPEEAAEGWDAADAIAEGFDVATFLTHGPRLQMHDVADDDADPVVSSDESVWGTEDALALAFTRRYHRDWRYVARWGRWLVWDGQRWRTEDTLAATDLIRSVCRQTAVRADNPKVAAKLASAGTVGGVERWRAPTAGTRPPPTSGTPIRGCSTPRWRGRSQDRPDAPARARRPDDQDHHGHASGDCPTWMAVPRRGHRRRQAELQAYLQRMVGYCADRLDAGARAVLPVRHGRERQVGVREHAGHHPRRLRDQRADGHLHGNAHRPAPDRHGGPARRALRGGHRNRTGRRWAESKVKNLTGGDKISARFMRQDFFEFFPQFKLFVAGNHKPAIRNIDEAMKRRLHLIPFTITVPPERRDKHLQQKLLAERDGILAWAVQGCLTGSATVGSIRRSVVSATEEYFEAEDALGRWLDERCVREANAKSLTAELFTDWKQWAEAAGEFVGSQALLRSADHRGLREVAQRHGRARVSGHWPQDPPQPAYTPYATTDPMKTASDASDGLRRNSYACACARASWRVSIRPRPIRQLQQKQGLTP
jgi:putative DNA primase/helicase